MDRLILPFTPRFITFTVAIVGTLATIALIMATPSSGVIWWLCLAAFSGLSAIGLYDLLQEHHAILRNYPIAAHLRFIFEEIRPEMRQYFFESEKDGAPFSRDRRAIVYQRAKKAPEKRPFGTQHDVYEEGYEWVHHSMAPTAVADSDFRVTVGGPDCTKPYSASVFNISAMSFGALSPNAIQALNKGAAMGGFAHDTGEGGFSVHHAKFGGDIIWEIGSGYFGARNLNGKFAPDRFAETAAHHQIKMIELKLSQGAKPGHGGVLPAAKVSAEIAAARGVAARRRLRLAGPPFRLLDADRDDAFHRRAAASVRRQADRLQALRRSSVGVSRHLQGHAGDGHLPGFHRGGRQGGRHGSGAHGIHGSSRHADARGSYSAVVNIGDSWSLEE